ncbi:ATP-binding protein [Arenibacter sp. GZD96]|uniref:sensor histidine kinase n=1 Tax=Aurantibrevibacter litoralis TaxID=3106030 RepID=UPI002AFF62CC|nr:ATP-binding protein [Arenibacter sp. GZD-96]MEA1786522.1 ATP-binding protein [Arenibacter sp. GZD-96]
MVSKNFYTQLIIRVVFIVLLALGFAFAFLKAYYLGASLLFLGLVLQTIYLIKFVNHTNRKIAYFFESIKNEDFTLRFPEEANVKSLKELNHSLNMLNGMIQQVHLKNLAQEQYYLEIIRQADIGIVTVNAKGHMLYANPKMEELLNYAPLNHIKQLAKVDNDLYTLFADLKPFERKLIKLTNERDKKQIAIKTTEITLHNETLLLVVAQDIHQELDENETDSWVRLIRVLTHEIMNSITPITSISDSILRYFKTKEDGSPTNDFGPGQLQNTVKGLEVIKEQGINLMDFVQSYRSFLNVPKPDKTIVHVLNLLEKVKVLMGQEKGTNNTITLEVDVTPTNLELFIDEKQILQVLINVVKNAFQAMSEQEGGKIQLSAGQNLQGKKYIEVKDNGPGIAPELIDEIFVPFFTTKKKGTGIGLSLSKQIMHVHGGSIKVRSEPEETSFYFIF